MVAVLLLGVLLIFVALFVVFAAIGGLSAERPGLNRSMAVIDALTQVPDEMKGDLEAPFRDRVLLPLLARAQGLGKRFSADDQGEQVRRKLDIAGNPPGWTADRFAASKVLGAVAGLIVSLLLSLVMGLPFLPTLGFVVVATLAGFMGPNMYLYQLGYDRKAKLQKALPDAIDLLTISVESGLGFDAAVAQVARNTEGPLAAEFSRMLQEMQIGKGRSEALRGLSDRVDLPDLRSFVSAMVQADEFGIPVGQVLRVQSSEIRLKRRQWAEEMAQKVPVKILVPLIFCILPCLFIAVLGPAAITMMENFSGKI